MNITFSKKKILINVRYRGERKGGGERGGEKVCRKKSKRNAGRQTKSDIFRVTRKKRRKEVKQRVGEKGVRERERESKKFSGERKRYVLRDK